MRRPADDICAVTTYFNPSGFKTKRRNYDRFVDAIRRDGIRCITVECVFRGSRFELPRSKDVIRINADDVMWQKERLLNIAIEQLPARTTKVVWLDADILFDESDWVARTSAALDEHAVVQPFETVVRLPPGVTHDDGRGETWRSFGAVMTEDPLAVVMGVFDRHGHTGFAWAARREVVERGLYDVCIAGSGDHMMAHAFAGDFESTCVTRLIGSSGAYRDHFAAWCADVYPLVRSQIGFVRGNIRHLWHGERANRRYVQRNRELWEMKFDPTRDLVRDAGGCWRWSAADTPLRPWMIEYFASRREDEAAPVPHVPDSSAQPSYGGL